MHDSGATRDRRPGRLRRYWQGMVLAAAVSYGQLQATGEARGSVMPPYVQMLPEQPPGFHPLEVVGLQVLTVPLDLSWSRRGVGMSGAMRDVETAP